MNSKKIIHRAKKGRPIRQVAAVPFRLTPGGEMQVMLITSRSTERFIVPKGWTMKGKSGCEAATCRMGRPFFALWIIFLLFMQLRPTSIQKR